MCTFKQNTFETDRISGKSRNVWWYRTSNRAQKVFFNTCSKLFSDVFCVGRIIICFNCKEWATSKTFLIISFYICKDKSKGAISAKWFNLQIKIKKFCNAAVAEKMFTLWRIKYLLKIKIHCKHTIIKTKR